MFLHVVPVHLRNLINMNQHIAIAAVLGNQLPPFLYSHDVQRLAHIFTKENICYVTL